MPREPTNDVEALLTSTGSDSALIQCRRTATIFSQGDQCEGVEQDLLAHLFNLDSTEQRLARALLRLAGYGTGDAPVRPGPKLSHERLAHLAGTTRARVDVLMREFQRLGFIRVGRDTQVHPMLISVVLDD